MRYKVLIDTLNHNGRQRTPGELIDMSETDAAPLIKVGAIEATTATIDPSLPGSGDQDNQNPESGNKESKSKAK